MALATAIGTSIATSAAATGTEMAINSIANNGMPDFGSGNSKKAEVGGYDVLCRQP